MKNISTLALILVATCIMLSSCSQTLNTSRMESHNPGSFSIGQGDNLKSETLKGESNTFQQKGYSSIQTDKEEQKDAIVENNMFVNVQQPLLTPSISNKKEKLNHAVGYAYNSDVKGLNRNTKESINESKDRPNTAQPVNYSDGRGEHSSNGVPFFIIFLFAFFIPPVGVALMYGITDKFWICLLLTLCFWLPGMIYAMIQIFR